MQKCGIIWHFNKIQRHGKGEGRKLKEKQGMKESWERTVQTPLYYTKTVVTWKTRLIIRLVSTYFSPELWPLRAGNLHRLSGNVRLCAIKFLFLSFFHIDYILWFNLSICPSTGEIFLYIRVGVGLYRRHGVWERLSQIHQYTINKAEIYWCCPLTIPVW